MEVESALAQCYSTQSDFATQPAPLKQSGSGEVWGSEAEIAY